MLSGQAVSQRSRHTGGGAQAPVAAIYTYTLNTDTPAMPSSRADLERFTKTFLGTVAKFCLNILFYCIIDMRGRPAALIKISDLTAVNKSNLRATARKACQECVSKHCDRSQMAGVSAQLAQCVSGQLAQCVSSQLA